MNTQAQVQAAKSQQEALVIIARAIDSLTAEVRQLAEAKQATQSDTWSTWIEPLSTTDPEDREANAAAERLAQDDRRAEQEVSKDGVTVTLPTVSEEKQNKRREFAIGIGVAEEFGDRIVESYAVGGPLLLYYNNRPFVMGLPDDARRRMVDDVFEESPSEAAEMGRDILKDMSPGVDQQTKTDQLSTDAENL